jgi:serine/threonine protein kinase
MFSGFLKKYLRRALKTKECLCFTSVFTKNEVMMSAVSVAPPLNVFKEKCFLHELQKKIRTLTDLKDVGQVNVKTSKVWAQVESQGFFEKDQIDRNEHKISCQLVVFPHAVYNKGLLSQYLYKDLSLQFLNEVTLGLLEGLIGIHEKGVIYRDINYSNLVLHEEDTTQGKKIVPYYLESKISINISDLSEFRQNCGSEFFTAIEEQSLFNRRDPKLVDRHLKRMSTKLDIYSLGILLGALWFKIKPSRDISTNKINDHYRYWNKPKNEKSLEYLIWAMTRDDPNDRPTALEALKRYVEAFGLGLAKQKTFTPFDFRI